MVSRMGGKQMLPSIGRWIPKINIVTISSISFFELLRLKLFSTIYPTKVGVVLYYIMHSSSTYGILKWNNSDDEKTGYLTL